MSNLGVVKIREIVEEENLAKMLISDYTIEL